MKYLDRIKMVLKKRYEEKIEKNKAKIAENEQEIKSQNEEIERLEAERKQLEKRNEEIERILSTASTEEDEKISMFLTNYIKTKKIIEVLNEGYEKYIQEDNKYLAEVFLEFGKFLNELSFF